MWGSGQGSFFWPVDGHLPQHPFFSFLFIFLFFSFVSSSLLLSSPLLPSPPLPSPPLPSPVETPLYHCFWCLQPVGYPSLIFEGLESRVIRQGLESREQQLVKIRLTNLKSLPALSHSFHNNRRIWPLHTLRSQTYYALAPQSRAMLFFIRKAFICYATLFGKKSIWKLRIITFQFAFSTSV